MVLTWETEVLGEKPLTVPLCAPQISHGLTWNRTRHLTVTFHDTALTWVWSGMSVTCGRTQSLVCRVESSWYY